MLLAFNLDALSLIFPKYVREKILWGNVEGENYGWGGGQIS